MDLSQALITNRPRETSGSKISNRYAFQKNWAICKLIELHNNHRDYLIIFDYHDDVVVLNSAKSPNKISFYQIKTKERNSWTVDKLVKREKSGNNLSNSIIGKLYLHKIKFRDFTEALIFVSNAQYNILLKDNSKPLLKDELCCNELHINEIKKVNLALKEEHDLNELPSFEEITFLKSANLDINHHTEITRDRLVQFIEKRFPEITYKIIPFYNTLIDEVKRKSNYEKEINSFDQLVQKKSMCRNDFERILDVIKLPNENEQFRKLGDKIEHLLVAEHVTMGFIKNFKNRWQILNIAKINPDKLFLKIDEGIKNLIKNLSNGDLDRSPYDCMALIYERYKQLEINQNIYDEYFIKTLILAELFEDK